MSHSQSDPVSSNELAAKILKRYGSTLKRMRDGTHFEHCWQDHWSCALDMCLAEIERLQRELSGFKPMTGEELRAHAVTATREPPHCSSCSCGMPAHETCHECGGDRISWQSEAAFKAKEPCASCAETGTAPNTKGSFGAECNRSSCKNVPATWRHRDLHNKFYCYICGPWINEQNGEQLCSPANR